MGSLIIMRRWFGWLVDMGNEVWGVLFICVIYSIRLIKSFTPISYFLI